MRDFAVHWTAQRHHLRGLALARILLGVSSLHLLLTHYADRRALWGPDSALDYGMFAASIGARGTFSLFALSDSPVAFEAVFHVGIVAALAFCVLGGRLATGLHALSLVSLYERAPTIMDGGDNLARIVIVFLLFATTDAHWSPMARHRRIALGETANGQAWSNAVHNTAVGLVVAQMGVVYASAGVLKLLGPAWRDGSALGLVAALDDYRTLPLLGLLAGLGPVAIVVSWSVIALESVAAPLLVWRRARMPAVAALAMMHAGIAMSLGLVGFMLSMWAGLAACLSDEQIVRFAERVRRFGRLGGIRPSGTGGRAPGRQSRSQLVA